ncbi:MAG: hypothetical protein JXR69_04755 [Candidatus Delongbacteria bacterium]|nr:hypothetical protein [Candidatus Delongbacteria bacterium]
MSSLYRIIKENLRRNDLNEVSKKAGLSTKLLTQILNDYYFGFISKINPVEPRKFLKILCSFTGMKELKINNRIEMFIRDMNSFKSSLPYIFVDTGFVRVSQPVFVLALFENSRRFKIKPEDDIGNIIREHFKKTEGKLNLWGKISQYFYHDELNRISVYDTKGNKIETDDINETCATLNI